MASAMEPFSPSITGGSVGEYTQLPGFGLDAGLQNEGIMGSLGNLFGGTNPSSQNSFLEGWTNKDKLGLGGLAIQGALGVGSYLGQNEMNKLALDQAKYDRVRQEKEDADYDAFKASWSNQFSNTAPANTATAPTSSTTIGTQVAPVSAFTG